MQTYLITHGVDNDMTTWEADDPAHAVEQCLDHLNKTPETSTINEVMLCVPVQNYKLDGTLFAFSRDGSYFGADALEVTVVPQEAIDRSCNGEEDLEYYLKELGNEPW